MIIKRLNESPNPLSEKVIDSGGQSFRLWLEFEETGPWEDLENDFALIYVNTLDGRNYGINAWTFGFLKAAALEESSEGNDNFIIPPDLFVKELSRTCIEETISELLSRGPLEEVLNETVFGLDFTAPFLCAIEMEEELVESLLNKLKLEIPADHVLAGEELELLAQNSESQELILELEDGRIVVILLGSDLKGDNGGSPSTKVYKDEVEFWKAEMRDRM